MQWPAFRERVRAEFGDQLEHATPANVREFVARWHREQMPRPQGGRFLVDDQAWSWEESVRHFFNGMLDLPSQEAALRLWLFAMEMWYSIVGCDYQDTFADLLGIDPETGEDVTSG